VLGDKPPTVDEIEAAKANYEANFWNAMQTIRGKGERLQSYLMSTGDTNFLATDVARYRAPSPAGVLKAGRDWMANRQRIVFHMLPEALKPASEGGDQ
jgi:hypothetical protein